MHGTVGVVPDLWMKDAGCQKPMLIGEMAKLHVGCVPRNNEANLTDHADREVAEHENRLYRRMRP